MNTYSIFSRKILGLDTRVWRLMLLLIALSIGLLSYKIINQDKCTPFNIDIGKKSHLSDSFYFTGENIRFIASISSEEINWDFNDNSVGKTKGSYVTHTFLKEGKYYVKAFNGSCEEGMLITIKKKLQQEEDQSSVSSKEILGASSTITGKVEEFISPVLADSLYEWVVLYHPEMGTVYGEKAKFQFIYGGNYTIQLTLDNNRINYYLKRVYVEDLKKPKMPEDVDVLIPPKIQKKEVLPDNNQNISDIEIPTVTDLTPITKSTFVADEIFKSYLQKLVENEMSESEFYKYLCKTGTTSVIVNGDKNHIMTFSWLCNDIKGKKGKKNILTKKRFITIDAVRLVRDENCVDIIEVNY